MFQWFFTLLDRICVVLGAFLFSQIPLFMLQYRQQLSGHVAELQFQVGLMQQAAQRSGKTLEQLIQKFIQSSDIDFVHQGEIMSAMVARLQILSEGLAAMNQASVWTRPLEFLMYYQSDIVKSTFEIFEMGIPLTFEGCIYVLAGIIVGYFTYWMVSKLVAKLCMFFTPAYLKCK